MSSFPADGAMEAICFFEPRNGSVFPLMGRLRNGFLLCRCFGASCTDAGGRSASDVVRRVGLGDLAGHGRTRPPVLGSHDASGGRVHRPDAFGTTLLARVRARPRIRKSINDRHMRAMPSHARQRLNASTRQSWYSNLCQIRLLPIGVRDRQHDECHISMTTEEDGEDERQQQSCSERHRFSVVRVASIEYEH